MSTVIRAPWTAADFGNPACDQGAVAVCLSEQVLVQLGCCVLRGTAPSPCTTHEQHTRVHRAERNGGSQRRCGKGVPSLMAVGGWGGGDEARRHDSRCFHRGEQGGAHLFGSQRTWGLGSLGTRPPFSGAGCFTLLATKNVMKISPLQLTCPCQE